MEIPKTLKLTPKTPMTKVKNPIDGKTYFVFNVSDGQDNWSQRRSGYKYTKKNLVINGNTLCNTHTMGMGLIYAGYYDAFKTEIDAIYPELPRLPDKLAKYLVEDKEILSYFKLRYPNYYKDFNDGVKNATSANEIHNILSYGTNRFLNVGTVTYFSTNVPWKEIIYDLIYNRTAVGISGKFSGLNHIVCVVGVAYEYLEDGDLPSEDQVPSFFIQDDPYGKTYEYYKGLSGNDIWIPFDKCVSDYKSLANANFKFAHRFVRPEHIGLI